ncbi:hypothetical protein DL765_010449 [Monosporascus sp. GIB2]|nr:hypothetical protein DL765_010449 [Monosporascus sp. GIB2]
MSERAAWISMKDVPFIQGVMAYGGPANPSFYNMLVTVQQPTAPSTNATGDSFPLADAELPLGPVCFSALVSFRSSTVSEIRAQEMSVQSRFAEILGSRPPAEWAPAPPVDIAGIVASLGTDLVGTFPAVDMRKVDLSSYNEGKPLHERRELLFYRLLAPLPASDPDAHIMVHAFQADRNGLLMVGNQVGIGFNFGRAASLSYSFIVHVNPADAVMKYGKDQWWIMEACFPRVEAGRAIIVAGPPHDFEGEQHLTSTKDIPKFGLGTWLSDRDKVAHAVEFALESGYNHIDAALNYKNEDETGKGIASANVSREDIWVTSKLWNEHHRPNEATKAIKKSISDLGVGYLDLYLMHWPVAFVPGKGNKLDKEITIVDTWRAMENLVRANLTRHIGISNFAKRDVQTILDICTICPYAHEFETHPYLQQQDFVDFHKEIGMKVIAYSPLANTNPTYDSHLKPILEDPFWKDLANKKGATVAQTVLAWGIQRGTIVIPKSVHEEYIKENQGALKIELTEEEMSEIAKQDKKVRMNDPGKSWGVKLFADLDDPTDLDEESREL